MASFSLLLFSSRFMKVFNVFGIAIFDFVKEKLDPTALGSNVWLLNQGVPWDQELLGFNVFFDIVIFNFQERIDPGLQCLALELRCTAREQETSCDWDQELLGFSSRNWKTLSCCLAAQTICHPPST